MDRVGEWNEGGGLNETHDTAFYPLAAFGWGWRSGEAEKGYIEGIIHSGAETKFISSVSRLAQTCLRSTRHESLA